jgi:hypothetical protein
VTRVQALVQVVARGIGISDSRIDHYLGHSDGSFQRRYSHQLDHQYLEGAHAFSAYLRRAVSPTRGDQVRNSA